jgi:hypothetical protein
MSPSDFPNELDPNQLDYNFMELDAPSDTEAADTVNMKGHAAAATDRIKISGDIKLAATGEIKLAAEELKLGADDPKLSTSIEDELASWAKKSA